MDNCRESSESYHSVHKNPIFCQILCDVCPWVCAREKQRLSETSEKYACLQHNIVCIRGRMVVCVCVCVCVCEREREQQREHSRFVGQLSTGQKHLSETHAYGWLCRLQHSSHFIHVTLFRLHSNCYGTDRTYVCCQYIFKTLYNKGFIYFCH